MNKIASISLLVLTLLIAVQPMLFLHLCPKEINSAAFQGKQETSCCANELPTDDKCCNDITFVLSTDSYLSTAGQFNFNLTSVLVVLQNYLLLTLCVDHDLDLKKIAHSGAIFSTVLDRLSFICVYRI